MSETGIDHITQQFADRVIAKMDNVFKCACLLWGVDIGNEEQVRARCTIVDQKQNDHDFILNPREKMFCIDNRYVLMYKDARIDPKSIEDLRKENNFTISASFQMSRVTGPDGKIHEIDDLLEQFKDEI